MIIYAEGTQSIFHASTRAIVNPVNCKGVMGKGLALEFKRRFPESFRAYSSACKKGELWPGKMLITHEQPLSIIHFPTKADWRDKSELHYISSGLQALIATLDEHSIESVAIPALGCGQGGLQWLLVKWHIDTAFSQRDDIIAVVYPPR
jgi:O-acetyl-ADP-ribose deacetylase (regulator of RNase III)